MDKTLVSQDRDYGFKSHLGSERALLLDHVAVVRSWCKSGHCEPLPRSSRNPGSILISSTVFVELPLWSLNVLCGCVVSSRGSSSFHIPVLVNLLDTAMCS